MVTTTRTCEVCGAPSEGLKCESCFEQQVVTAEGFTIAQLRKVMDAIQNPDDWKGEWAAAVPHQIVTLVMRAVEHFHGATPRVVGIQPITGKVLMSGDGYAC